MKTTKIIMAIALLLSGSFVFGQVSHYSNPQGTLVVGPQNSSWNHFITDRPAHYFNKRVTVNGEIASYNQDLKLGTTSGSTFNTHMTINANGNTFLNGDLRLGTNQWVLLGGANLNPGTPRIGIVHSNNLHGYIDYLENLYFRVDGGSTSALVLEGTGNVGIGMNTSYTAGATHTQGYRLAVNGGILCEEVKVILDVPASDFVFEDDYHLTSLEEVEAYVKQNKHLPEVPSAQEFKENGYKVGEMDDLLLRKVEELTLYIIELNKKVEAQEKVIEGLKGKE